MKLNRLLEITTILLNKKTVKASELAGRFDVSVRTIYRDIDVLSASGVPVFCSRGTNGGISLLEEYTVSRAALSDNERDNILFALQTLQSTRFPEADAVLEKLAAIFNRKASDWISIDLSPWGSNPDAYNKFTDIKTAILQSRVIEIDYINSAGEKNRRGVEPLRLIFKSQSWYLWGFCRYRHDYRLFRISRIRKVNITGEAFERGKVREEPPEPAGNKKIYVRLILEFTSDALYRLHDDYDDEHLRDNGDGTYTLDVTFPEDEWVYGYILSFGASVRVIEPESVRDIIKKRAQSVAALYI